MHWGTVMATPKGGALRLEQGASAQGLHNSDGHSGRLTGGVQLLTGLIYHKAALLHALELHQVIDVGLSGLHVIGGVDAEHQHVNDYTLHCLQGNVGIVGAHADMADYAVFLQHLGVGENGALKYGAEVLLAVHIVDHTYINIVGVETLQQILKGAAGLFDVSGAGVLPVLKYGAQMPLDDKFLPASLQSHTQVAAGGGLGHENVDVVDALFLCCVYNGGALLSGQAVEPLAAQTDFADPQSGAAQCPVFHVFLLSVIPL